MSHLGAAPKVACAEPPQAAARAQCLCADVVAFARERRRADAAAGTRSALDLAGQDLRTLGLEGLQRLGGALDELQRALVGLGLRIEAADAAHVSVACRRALVAAGGAPHRRALAASLQAQAAALADLGRVADAAAPARESVRLRRGLARDGAAGPRREFAAGLCDHARWLSRTEGGVRKAARRFRQALDLLEPCTTADPFEWRLEHARTCNAWGTCLGDHGRAEEAAARAQRAIMILRETLPERPQAVLPELAKALHNAGIWLSRVGRLEEGLAAANESVTLYRALLASKTEGDARSLAWALVTLGNRLADAGRHGLARAVRQEAATCLLRLPLHDVRLWARLAGVVVDTLGEPEDLAAVHLPLLGRLEAAEESGRPEVADVLQDLKRQVVARIRCLLGTLPPHLGDARQAALHALLATTRGEAVAGWARECGLAHEAAGRDPFGHRQGAGEC